MTRPDSITYLDLLRTGKLRDIGLGASRPFVQECFGDPDQWGIGTDVPDATIWKYGVVEFHFQDDHVFLLHCERFGGMPRHLRLPLKPWKLRDDSRIEEVERLLEAEGLRFLRERLPGNESVLTLDNFVRLYFAPPPRATLGALSVMKHASDLDRLVSGR